MVSWLIIDIILSVIFVGIIILLVKLMNSESKAKRILGKIILGILLSPIIIVLLLLITCWVIFNL